ncbi:hypothetical protein EIG99_09975 [Staphylococcus condimenti]|uniref:Membrane-associated protein n=1 Tax=Staphylococcus condimenti TaxID=70255 RepID=A0A4V2DWB4_9STAP|nr:hypothetical protein [Staphylococcus condimenti]RZI00969.1 hypothetical protein EIG99_09975 [Staphylococcus condimenti]RZI02943.1 hypothetical protein EIG98_07685 [Staphylococcus condimenti]
MKYCKYCGHPLKNTQKVCTQCGKNVEPSKIYIQPPEQPKRRKTAALVILSIIFVGSLIAVLLTGLFFLGKFLTSPEQQAEKVSSAIKENNQEQFAKLVHSDGKNLTEDESKAYFKLLKRTENLQKVSNQIKEKMIVMQQEGKSEAVVTLDYNDEYIKIRKTGTKKWLLFDDYEFLIPTQKFMVDNTGQGSKEISYEKDGKNYNLDLESKDLYGPLPIGVYDLPATKTLNDKTLKGRIEIVISSQMGVAKPKFDQLNFYVINENEDIPDDAITLYINNKPQAFKNYNLLGPYSADKGVEVYAKAKIGNQTFTSEKESVKYDKNAEVEPRIKLKFDDDAIAKAIDKDKDTNDKKEKVTNDEKKEASSDKKDSEEKNKPESHSNDTSSDSESDKETEKEKKKEQSSLDDDPFAEEKVPPLTKEEATKKINEFEGKTLESQGYKIYDFFHPNGGWYISIMNKNDYMMGSYIIRDDNGKIEKYDEFGDLVRKEK